MNRYHIVKFFAFFFFSVLFLSGCRDSEQVKLVKSELNQLQKLDENTIRTFISYENILGPGASSNISSEVAQTVQLFFQDFDYRILSSKITEDTATVTAEIQNIDTKKLAKDLCLELIARSSSPHAEDNAILSGSSYFALLHDFLSQNQYESVKTEVHFHLKKIDGQWSIQGSEVLEDELLGGFISCLHDPYLVTPEEITAKLCGMLKAQTPEEWISYLGIKDIFSTYSTLSDKVDLALASQISKCFSYSIQEVTVTGNKAKALADITSLDMGGVLDEYLERLLDYASTTEAVRATDTELADKTAALLAECLNTNRKTCTKTVEINFTNNGTTWEMQLNDNFTDALLGDIKKAAEAFQSAAASTESNTLQ
ncbi:hypothetical protein AALA00_04930 [Lachnospiraceae bacterium 46-15]